MAPISERGWRSGSVGPCQGSGAVSITALRSSLIRPPLTEAGRKVSVLFLSTASLVAGYSPRKAEALVRFKRGAPIFVDGSDSGNSSWL